MKPKFGRGVFLSEKRLGVLKQRVAGKIEPTFSAYQGLSKAADTALAVEPSPPADWYVPPYYKKPEEHVRAKEALQNDANNAYALALAYRMSGDEKYAAAAARNINAWATRVRTMNRKDDSMLSFSYHFPGLILAADLIRPSQRWPQEQQLAFQRFVRDMALPMNTMSGTNNWGNWGLVLVMTSAVYLEDPALFDAGIARWKEFIESQIAEDGHLPHEVTRNSGRGDYGISYSNFTLWPQSIAAEVARLSGVDLYEYRSPSGRTLRLAFEKLAPWVLNPSTFPYYKGTAKPQKDPKSSVSYFEVLNPRWPDKAVTEALNRWRPLSDARVAPFITFTHGGLPADL